MPCWNPRNTLLHTTVVQFGANITMKGINRPSIHPINIGTLRPYKSASIPTTKLATAFDMPNATSYIRDSNLLSTTNVPSLFPVATSTVINA